MASKKTKQFVYQSGKIEIAAGAGVTAIVRNKEGGTLKHITFLSGVHRHFVVKNLSINRKSVLGGQVAPEAFPILNAPVPADSEIEMMAKNVSDKPALFSYQVAIEQQAPAR